MEGGGGIVVKRRGWRRNRAFGSKGRCRCGGRGLLSHQTRADPPSLPVNIQLSTTNNPHELDTNRVLCRDRPPSQHPGVSADQHIIQSMVLCATEHVLATRRRRSVAHPKGIHSRPPRHPPPSVADDHIAHLEPNLPPRSPTDPQRGP